MARSSRIQKVSGNRPNESKNMAMGVDLFKVEAMLATLFLMLRFLNDAWTNVAAEYNIISLTSLNLYKKY
jgi:hypothetical protein